MTVLVLVCLAVALAAALLGYAVRSARTLPAEPPSPIQPVPKPLVRAEVGEIDVIRPSANSVEGLEIRYLRDGLVRSVRVGAMNCEHKELLLTMDEVVWRTLPNAHKQEVLAAARSTWAAKMCPSGPDIAYVVVKTEHGEIVGRASPRSISLSQETGYFNS